MLRYSMLYELSDELLCKLEDLTAKECSWVLDESGLDIYDLELFKDISNSDCSYDNFDEVEEITSNYSIPVSTTIDQLEKAIHLANDIVDCVIEDCLEI